MKRTLRGLQNPLTIVALPMASTSAQQVAPKPATARDERNRFVAFAFAGADVLVETDEAGRIMFAAGATESVFGVSAEKLAGTHLFKHIPDADREKIKVGLSRLKPGRRLASLPVHVDRGGSAEPVRISGCRLPDIPGRIFLALRHGWGRPLAVERRNETRDLETGLLDKNSFSDAVQARLVEAKESGEDCNLTFVDISEISKVRNEIDDKTEAEIYAEVSEVLKSHSADGDLAGRIEGDKFGLVHDRALNVPDLNKMVEETLHRVAPVTKAIQIAASTIELDDSGMTEEETAQAVVYTLNKFSETRDGTFSLDSLSQGGQEMMKETVVWMKRIKQTIAKDNFELVYQPIVSLGDGSVHHYEALTRLPEDNGGSPYKFITMAEQLGNIGEFDFAVFKRVARIIRTGDPGPDASVAVNLSGRSLSTPGFVETLIAFLKTDLRIRKQIVFEITESSKIDDLQTVNKMVQAIRDMKIAVCLDDFGVGAAAFEYLRSLQVDYVKIDGSFVKDMPRSPFGRAFVRSVAALCAELDIQTIAEMVEGDETVNLVTTAGVDYAQGWHYGKPVAKPEWVALGGDAGPATNDRSSWDPVSGRRRQQA